MWCCCLVKHHAVAPPVRCSACQYLGTDDNIYTFTIYVYLGMYTEERLSKRKEESNNTDIKYTIKIRVSIKNL